MLNKVKKRTTRVEQAGPISDRDATRRQIETKNRRLNQDGRTKVIPPDHPLLSPNISHESASNPTFDPTNNTTNDSFGPTSLYAESNDSAQSEHSTSEHINLNDIDIDAVQNAQLDVINKEEEEEVFVAEINIAPDVSPTPTKTIESRKSGRVGKKPASFKDSVLTTIKSKSKLLIKKSGVVANSQVVIDPVNSSKKLKGVGKKSESNEGPEAYNSDEANEIEEDSEKSDSDEDTSSSTDSESDEEEEKKSEEKERQKRKER